MEESIEPLLNNDDYSNLKSQKKKKGGKSASSTNLFVKKFSFDLGKPNIKEPKEKKIENKFIFKVYLHFFVHIIFILLIILLSFKNNIFYSILSNNKYLFYAFVILSFIMLIFPLFNEQIVKIRPYNYFYLFLFTISISYIICKILIIILINPSLIKVFSILFIFELLYLIIDAYISKKNDFGIWNTIAFMGLCQLFIGATLYFVEKISILNLILIFLIVLLIGIYLIYDMNLIFLEKRRKFEENDYVLATIFLYIDIIQTFFELIEKFYNSCEPERKPIQKGKESKSMIYIGDEAYDNLYNRKSEENKNKFKNDYKAKLKRIKSAKIFKFDSKIIKENENENENEDSESDDDDYELGFKP